MLPNPKEDELRGDCPSKVEKKWSFEVMQREAPAPDEVEDRIKFLVNIMYEESYSLDQLRMIHIQGYSTYPLVIKCTVMGISP